MVAPPRGSIGARRSGRVKQGTASSKNHVFQSFSQRIALIKIEPVRHSRGPRFNEDELDGTFSYFKNAFQEWRELNMSESFSSFARRIAPLCENLPQVLHHSESIVALLAEYIERGEKLCEESLLSLTVHLAHDLGGKFEKYFERIVKIVSRLAATHPDVEVIEWSFGCLAWLFKYLSRYLVSDLRPVFDLMLPMLGGERQKPFVARFAAESLGFLVRKAGARHRFDKAPLERLVQHISDQLVALQGTGREYDFEQAIAHLFVDSMKGVQQGFHSSATVILRELLMVCYGGKNGHLRHEPLEPVLVDVLTASIYHSDATTFKALLDTILIQIDDADTNPHDSSLSFRLMFVVCSVCRGDRIDDWDSVLTRLDHLLVSTQHLCSDKSIDIWEILSAVTVAFQYCAFNAAISHEISLGRLTQGVWENFFLAFCDAFADVGTERFQRLLLPHFKRFLVRKVQEHSIELCVSLPRLHQIGVIPSGVLQCPKIWEAFPTHPFKNISHSTAISNDCDTLYICNASLSVISCLGIPEIYLQTVISCLEELVEGAVNINDMHSIRLIDTFAVGHGLRFLVEETSHHDVVIKLWPALCRASDAYVRILPFWQALLALLQREKQTLSLEGPHMEGLRRAMMLCLSSPSHDMRLVSINILRLIRDEAPNTGAIHSIILAIEQTPPDFGNQRALAAHIGQLTRLYSAVCLDEWLGMVIPAFCFGLLHTRLTSIWNDTCQALKAMFEMKEGQTTIMQISLDWLRVENIQASNTGDAQTAHPKQRRVSNFYCTNVVALQECFAKTRTKYDDLKSQLKLVFDEQHGVIPLHNFFCRVQALRLMNMVPNLAIKQSRHLVPILLEWTKNISEKSEDSVHQLEESSDTHGHWTMMEKKALMSVFATFTNPRVLHRASETYQALLDLLCHGNVEFQKMALRGLLAWKNLAINTYQEQLTNLLDDAKFGNELSFFFQKDSVHEKDLEQMLPVLLRLLYGRVVAGKHGCESKRKSVFVGIKGLFGDRGISQFLHIALGPLNSISILFDPGLNEHVLRRDLIDARKQVGILKLLEDLLSTLRTDFSPFLVETVDSVLYCGFKATRQLSHPKKSEDGIDETSVSKTSLLKTIRQRALQFLGGLFEIYPDFAWLPYMPPIVKELVEPRLERLPIETTQSVSGLFRLFSAWSKSSSTVTFLVDYNQNILTKVTDCLAMNSTKDEVKCFILDEIFRKIISIDFRKDERAEVDGMMHGDRTKGDVLQYHLNVILSTIGNILQQNPSKELLESSVRTIADLAPYIMDSSESKRMIEVAQLLLRQPTQRVGHRMKLDLLKIIHKSMPNCNERHLSMLFESLCESIHPLLAFVQDHSVRCLACDILQDLFDTKDDLKTTAGLCKDLNSHIKVNVIGPDFERCSRAFDLIKEGCHSYTLTQWKPIVSNMLYLIQDNDELSIRVNASIVLRRFIDVSDKDDFRAFLTTNVLPGIRRGMRHFSELIRIEFLAVLQHLVITHHDWAPVADLHILISDHEESSFFNNILHIQSHRRIRALRRLAAHFLNLQSINIFHYLIPLLEHFVSNKADEHGADNLHGETIKTLTCLALGLEWSQFRSLCKKYSEYLNTKEDMQKSTIKLIVGLMSSLNEAGRVRGYVDASTGAASSSDVCFSLINRGDVSEAQVWSTLAKTLPLQETLKNEVLNQILPNLTSFLHKKDEATVSLRVPIATAITKALLVLPFKDIQSQLPAILLDICYILKSRAQESRDLSRNTLSDIATTLGPAYLGFILKALRTALQRGYQLHVLSFTLHLILVKLSEQISPGDLDYCLADVTDVVMNDIFGSPGQEKDADEYTSNMKEVKNSKSFDSIDILARSTTPAGFMKLLLPLRALLTEKLSEKTMHKIDESLRRIGLGISQNSIANNRDVLMFCFELIQDVYDNSPTVHKAAETDTRTERYLIHQKFASKSGARLSTSSFLYKLVRFSLDILRAVLRKHVQLQTPQNLAGFLPIIGDAIVQKQEEVQISAIRCLTLVIKVPLKEFDDHCAVYVDEAFRAVKGAASFSTELAQASLKLISAILREKPNVEIKEQNIGYLIKRVLPDLDQPDRSGAIFDFLKAVTSRRLEVPEIYEIMDYVAEVMITNQTKSTRDVARNLYFQFLTSYKQSDKRFKKQMEFLLRNLQYEHSEGRISVMEALNLILDKALPRLSEKDQHVYHGMTFLPLMNVVANDNAKTCREMAGLLMQRLFHNASERRLRTFTADLRRWLEQDNDAGLKRTSIQCWSFMLEGVDAESSLLDFSFVLGRLEAAIGQCLARRKDNDWELLYFSLCYFLKASETHENLIFSSSREGFWAAIQASTSYPHAWVKLKAAELMALFFTHLSTSSKDKGLQALPLEGSSGLQLSEQSMVQLCDTFLKNLQDMNVSERLCAQSVKNIGFLAKCLAANAATWQPQANFGEEIEMSGTHLQMRVDKAVYMNDPESESESESDHSHQLHTVRKGDVNSSSAIHHLTVRLSCIVRRDTTSLIAKVAAISILKNMVTNFPLESFLASIPHLLLTIDTLLDSATSVPHNLKQASNSTQGNETYESFVNGMHEIMNILQRRMDTQEYLKTMAAVKETIRKRRGERRVKRKIEAVADPEKWEKDKRRKNEKKRQKRKERGSENREKRKGR